MLALLMNVLHVVRASVRSRSDLLLEIAALRHQLEALQRSRVRPRLRRQDRILWIWLCRTWSKWRQALVIVQPETVLAWHRAGFRAYWRWRSHGRPGRPRIPRSHVGEVSARSAPPQRRNACCISPEGPTQSSDAAGGGWDASTSPVRSASSQSREIALREGTRTDPEQGAAFGSVEAQRHDKDLPGMRTAQTSPETRLRKDRALAYLPIVVEGARWSELQHWRGEHLSTLVGTAYQPATLDKYARGRCPANPSPGDRRGHAVDNSVIRPSAVPTWPGWPVE